MKALAKTETQEIANIERNFFEQYGDSVGRRNITGRLLKFSKGEYLAGQDNEEIEAGTRLTVNMDTFMVGWIKWVNNRPEQQIMGLIKDGYQPPKRSELDSTDPSGWEVDDKGEPRDPWQFSNYVIMKPVGDQYVESEAYTFAISSYGGMSALAALSKEYGGEVRQNPGVYPIVELEVRTYEHPNKKFGRIKNPLFNIVGWEDKELFEERAAPVKKSTPKKGKRTA